MENALAFWCEIFFCYALDLVNRLWARQYYITGRPMAIIPVFCK